MIKSKIENVYPSRALSSTEYVLSLNKRTSTLIRPKYGMKGYHLQDSKLKDKIYQIPKIVKYIEGQKIKDGYIDHAVKEKGWVPFTKIKLTDWSDMKFTPGGKSLKGAKISMTEEAMNFAKKKGIPAPNAYFKDLKPDPGAKSSVSKGPKYCGFIEHAKWES